MKEGLIFLKNETIFILDFNEIQKGKQFTVRLMILQINEEIDEGTTAELEPH